MSIQSSLSLLDGEVGPVLRYSVIIYEGFVDEVRGQFCLIITHGMPSNLKLLNLVDAR